MESLNSSISIQLKTAPAMALPLLSSRVVARRFFASERMAGRCADSVLQDLEATHPDSLEWAASGGHLRRFATPSPPFDDLLLGQEAAGRRQRQGVQGPMAAEAAATLACWLDKCPETRVPTVQRVVAFGRSRRGGEDMLAACTSFWCVALRYYSQLWVARVAPSGRVSTPLEFRKLLAVIESELRQGRSEATA